MNEPVKIKDCEVLNVLLSEIPQMILPKYRQIVDPEYVQALLKTLSDDILFMRKDREVEIEFFFSNSDFTVDINYGYIHLRKNTVLRFDYKKDPEKTINDVIYDAIETVMREEHAHFLEMDIKKAHTYFENIDTLDQCLGLNGRLNKYVKSIVYKNTFYELKDVFEDFEVIASGYHGPYLTLKKDDMSIIVFHEAIIFKLSGIELKFSLEKVKSDTPIVDTIKKHIGGFF